LFIDVAPVVLLLGLIRLKGAEADTLLAGLTIQARQSSKHCPESLSEAFTQHLARLKNLDNEPFIGA
jgi:hypothetical protein